MRRSRPNPRIPIGTLATVVVCLGSAVSALAVFDPNETADSVLDQFDTLNDPTILSSRAGVTYEYLDQHHQASREKLVLGGAWAFGAQDRRDWILLAELPATFIEPGRLPSSRIGGLGDLKLGLGHVLDDTGRFRWGLGLGATFDTASHRPLGDAAFQLSPRVGAGFRFTEDFECVANLSYARAVDESASRPSVETLEFNPALVKTWPHRWFSMVGWNNGWDLHHQGAYTGKLRTESGHSFGLTDQWLFAVGADIPIVNPGGDQFALHLALQRMFR